MWLYPDETPVSSVERDIERLFMRTIPFIKMQGIGNDYVYIDAINNKIQHPELLAPKISDRHFGVGGDGLILLLPSEKADFRMRMFNADGTEAQMCGNGIRCLSKMIYDHGFSEKKELAIETLAGIKEVSLEVKNHHVVTVAVDMGLPRIERSELPMIGDPGSVIEENLELDDAVTFQVTAVSMGNPHCVIFVEDVDNFPLAKYGPMIENHPLFPERVNVEFVEIISGSAVRQRTWERGSGETLACGTGASAVCVAGSLARKLDRKVLVHLRGGDLSINWDVISGKVFMTGPAEEVFRGEWSE